MFTFSISTGTPLDYYLNFGVNSKGLLPDEASGEGSSVHMAQRSLQVSEERERAAFLRGLNFTLEIIFPTFWKSQFFPDSRLEKVRTSGQLKRNYFVVVEDFRLHI